MESAKNINKNESLMVFSPGNVAAAMGPDFLDEEKCRRWILRQLHPRGAFCPNCGEHVPAGPAVTRFWQSEVIKCKACNFSFSAKTGTILSAKNLSYQEIFLLSFLMDRGASNLEIAETVKCTRETVRLWRRNFEAWATTGGAYE